MISPLPVDNGQFLQAAVTIAAGALIFLTLERRILQSYTISEAGEEQRKHLPFTDRLERLRKEGSRKYRLAYLLSFVERWARVIMFFLLLTSISMVVLGIDFNSLNEIPLSRVFFVASLVSLLLRVYLHGLK